jgi:hypothetical protein
MKLLQKIAAGVFLSIGFLFIVTALITIVKPDPEASAQDNEDTILGCFLLGIPPSLVGGYLIWNLYNQNLERKKTLKEQQDKTFFQVVEEYKGSITILRFAMAAQIPVEEAQKYLDEKAVQLNATFDTNEAGDVIYQFRI